MEQFKFHHSSDLSPVFTGCREKAFNSIKNSFKFFNFYLWIHFIGYTKSCGCSLKGVIVPAISVFLSIFNDGTTAIILILNLSQLFKEFSIFLVIKCLTEFGELFMRLSLYFNRSKLNDAVVETAALYATQARNSNIRNFEKKVVLVLMIKDLYFISQIWLVHFSNKNTENLQLFFVDINVLFSIPPLWTKSFLNFMLNLQYLNKMSNFFGFYFCSICYGLKHTLLELKENILRRSCSMDMTVKFHEYDEIAKFISWINDTFHNMLFVTLSILLTWVFWNSYIIIAVDQRRVERSSRVMLLLYSFLEFCAICFFASSVTKAASDIGETICSLPLGVVHAENLPFLFKTVRKFSGFTLFDSIVIDKSMIISAVGLLLTYGVLIFTLGR